MATTTAAQQILGSSGMDFRSNIPEQYWVLIERYREGLMRQAVGVLGNLEDAEDVVQETFCEVFRDPKKVSQSTSIGATLRLINRHNSLNRLRDRGRASKRSQRKQEDTSLREFTTGGFSALELRDSVLEALRILSPNMQEVVKLRYWEHLSYKEIAERLHIPIGTVGPLLTEASLLLYGKLKVQL